MSVYFYNLGSLSDDEESSEAKDSTPPPGVDEPGYVEILGGEEPPDEWLNLGAKRERIDSSSSSSDGSGFEYISGGGDDTAPYHSHDMDEVQQAIHYNIHVDSPALIFLSSQPDHLLQ